MPSLLRGGTPPIGRGTSASIAVLERTALRGHDASQPLLRYVHAGPGTPSRSGHLASA
jgi:hypothetical protein